MKLKECTSDQFATDETVYDGITVIRITAPSNIDALIYDTHMIGSNVLVVYCADNQSSVEIVTDYLVSINAKTGNVSYCSRYHMSW